MTDGKSKKCRILLIEDDPDEVMLTRETLTEAKGAKFELECFDRLQPGLDRLGAGDIDVILLDLSLPDSQGMETFAKTNEQFPDIPIIVLTSLFDDSVAVKAVQQGAQDYLVKGQLNSNLFVRAILYAIERNASRIIREEALKHLRELNETKSQFVAEASHELRTPLAIIREFASLVHDEVTGPLTEKQRNCLQSVLKNCDRLTELINKMLDLAKIEAGKTELNRERVEIASLLTQSHEDFLPVCQSKKQKFLLEVQDGLPAAYCDVKSINNVLINLIGNAQKFTPEEGTIYIGCQQEGQFLSIYVADNGKGIAPEAQERIFDAFAQVDREDGPGAKGTGLGLTIVRSLVQLNGGYVTLESEPGKGSRFSFTLPVYDKEAPRRILVVDDDENVLKLITRILKSSDLNLEVKSTVNALESLIIAGQFNPDLVILDVHLAEVGGEQILASIKEEMPKDSGKVLTISGDIAALTELDEQGADDHLEKPFSAQDLIHKVVTLLGIERRKK